MMMFHVNLQACNPYFWGGLKPSLFMVPRILPGDLGRRKESSSEPTPGEIQVLLAVSFREGKNNCWIISPKITRTMMISKCSLPWHDKPYIKHVYTYIYSVYIYLIQIDAVYHISICNLCRCLQVLNIHDFNFYPTRWPELDFEIFRDYS